MSGRALTPKEALAVLAATPSRLSALSEGVTPVRLRLSPGPDEWSANDVLAHLRSCSDMWGGYIMRILAEDRPTFRAVNPTAWIKQTDYLDLDFHVSLRAFATQRVALLALLEPLPPAAWSRAALVTGAGAPRERTVREYAERLARHERPHLKQIERIGVTLRDNARLDPL